MRQPVTIATARRISTLIVVLWRASLRINKALSLIKTDLDRRRSNPGRAWSATARVELRQLALIAGVGRRFAPHQLRHAHAVELMHEEIPLPLIQRQL